jgi:hypothetical protein
MLHPTLGMVIYESSYLCQITPFRLLKTDRHICFVLGFSSSKYLIHSRVKVVQFERLDVEFLEKPKEQFWELE